MQRETVSERTLPFGLNITRGDSWWVDVGGGGLDDCWCVDPGNPDLAREPEGIEFLICMFISYLINDDNKAYINM